MCVLSELLGKKQNSTQCQCLRAEEMVQVHFPSLRLVVLPIPLDFCLSNYLPKLGEEKQMDSCLS